MFTFKSYLFVRGLFFLFLAQNLLQAQDIPDSLLRKFVAAPDDSAKGITLLEMGESIEQTLPLKSIDYYRQALVLGQRIANNRVILSSYIDLGICNINLNKMDSAILFFEKAISISLIFYQTCAGEFL